MTFSVHNLDPYNAIEVGALGMPLCFQVMAPWMAVPLHRLILGLRQVPWLVRHWQIKQTDDAFQGAAGCSDVRSQLRASLGFSQSAMNRADGMVSCSRRWQSGLPLWTTTWACRQARPCQQHQPLPAIAAQHPRKSPTAVHTGQRACTDVFGSLVLHLSMQQRAGTGGSPKGGTQPGRVWCSTALQQPRA